MTRHDDGHDGLPGWLFGARYLTRLLYAVPGGRRLADPVRHRAAQRWPGAQALVAGFDGSLRMWCHLDDHIGSMVFWSGSYSPNELAVMKRLLQPQSWVVDVGANIGVFTLVAASTARRGRVLAFEPESTSHERLHKNVSENGFDNVVLSKTGLGAKASTVNLFAPAGMAADGTYNRSMCSLYPHGTVEAVREPVEVRTLDDVVPASSEGHIDLIKMDIEGGELPALLGMRETISTNAPALLLELNHEACLAAGYHPREIVALLRGEGYAILEIEPRRSGRRPRLRELLEAPCGTRNVVAVCRPEHRRLLERGF